MPRGRGGRSQVAGSQHQGENDSMMSQSQATATQAQRAVAAMSQDEQDRKANELVQYLLVMDQKKIPIKRQDITKNVMKEHSRAFGPIMELAKKKLGQVFGFQVKELEGKTQKSYILLNQLECDQDESHLVYSDAENQRSGFLMVVLSVIFMNDNLMNDETLYSMLKVLGVDVEHIHPLFGEVKKLLHQDFVRQQYIEVTCQPGIEPPVYEFRWGQRAKAELTKMNCLKFMTEVYGMEDMQQWTSQWKDVQCERELQNGHANGHNEST